MRRFSSLLLVSLCFAGPSCASAQSAAPAAGGALPNASELLQRALANERKHAAERERYSCRVTDNIVSTDGKGNTKKNTSVVKEKFFVNGVDIERTLQKNGRDLTPEESKKEDERVMKETLKYTDEAAAKKVQEKEDRQMGDFLEATMLANGHRERSSGRSVLVYDIVPNPRFEAKNLNQRMAQVLAGKISIDEQTGETIEIEVRSVADLKVGAGLFVNLHKGLWFHMHNHAEADGVWLTDLAEGSGDARAALFLHPYFRFRETTDNCRLYSATAIQAGQAQPVKKP